MMIFNGILKTADIGRVLEILKTHYDSSDNDIESYRQLFGSLLNMEAKPSKYRISITHVTDDYDGEEYDTVDGIVPGEKMHCSLELTRRDEWLGMELEEDTLKNYTADEIAAHCLWEMTFHGFSEERNTRSTGQVGGFPQKMDERGV